MFGRQPSTVSGSGMYISNSRLYCIPLGRPPTMILVKAAVNNTEALLGNIRARTRRDSIPSRICCSDSVWFPEDWSKSIHSSKITKNIVIGFILKHSTDKAKLSSIGRFQEFLALSLPSIFVRLSVIGALITQPGDRYGCPRHQPFTTYMVFHMYSGHTIQKSPINRIYLENHI